PADGSCWVADGRDSQVVHLVIPGWRVPRFYDVPPYSWAFEQVEACADANIVKGFEDDLYHPEYTVTRDQMAVYISRTMAGGDENVPPARFYLPSFRDVPFGYWAYRYIEYLAANGVAGGYDGRNYWPQAEVTRDQMAAFIARAMVAPGGDAAIPDPEPPATFPDVPDTFWSYRHVEYCVSQSVVAGYTDGLYHPERVVTRDQMAVYIARAFGLL
ncbi:MAG: S-layer homology domain-containing protein, partial [Armatimonadota bacterium]